jgi:hypothetical protein
MSKAEQQERDEFRYLDEVEGIVMGFRYSWCEECGLGLNRHVISPGPLGNAHAWCPDTSGEA